jgi:aspartyl protease family protein
MKRTAAIAAAGVFALASVSVINDAQAQRPASPALNCGAATVDFGNDDDPNVVVSTYVARDPGQWMIQHTLADGTVVDRSLQYAITDFAGPSVLQWRGTYNRNPNMTMVGEVRLNSTGRPTYNEWLYKDGQMVMHSMALCQYDRPVSTAATPAQPPPPLSVAPAAPGGGQPWLPWQTGQPIAASSTTPIGRPEIVSQLQWPSSAAKVDGTQSNQTGKRIPLRLSGNSYIVPVLINGRIWLDFMIDTGASDVSITTDVATTLMRAGTITNEDIGGEQNYRTADGGTVKGTQFRIHSLQVGEGDNAVIAQNVGGSIGGPQGSLLLGQSFLRRFRSTTIDHVNSVLIIDGSESQPPVPTALQPAPVPQPAHPASVQPGPILLPPMPEFRCNPGPEIRLLGAAFGLAGDGGRFINGWLRTCLARYDFAMLQWRAEVLRIQMLNQQRGY